MEYDRMTLRQLLKVSLFSDTTELEISWTGRHVGFNHLKMEQAFRDHFEIVRRHEISTVFYVIRR
jgi:hypothetical protein